MLNAALALLLAAPAAAGAPPAFVSEGELGAAVASMGSLTRTALEAKPRGMPDAAALFAFAVERGGYAAWCRANECKPSALIVVEPSEHVRKDHNGWYSGGNAYVKDRPNALSLEITTAHEFTHHLQRLSNRYQQYRGVCNQYLAEKEAYEVGEAYARSKGFTTNYEKRLAPYERRCRAAVTAGLVKAPPGLPAGFFAEPGR